MLHRIVIFSLVLMLQGCGNGRDERAERKKRMDEISAGLSKANRQLNDTRGPYIPSEKERSEREEELRKWKSEDDARRERMAIAWARLETDREVAERRRYEEFRASGRIEPAAITVNPPTADYMFTNRAVFDPKLEKFKEMLRELDDGQIRSLVPPGVYELARMQPPWTLHFSRRWQAYQNFDPNYTSIED